MKYILHYGLQRSGTNFFYNLIDRNYKVKFLNSDEDRRKPIQKHFRLYDDKSIIPHEQYHNELNFDSFAAYEQALGLKKEIKAVFLISKDPYSWLSSYKNWAKKCDWPTPGYHYAQEYNAFYKKWTSFALEDERIISFRYIDFLENPDAQLDKIENRLGFELKLMRKLFGRVGTMQKVAQSGDFSQERQDYYLKKQYLEKYSAAEIETINSFIEPEVMARLGYSFA